MKNDRENIIDQLLVMNVQSGDKVSLEKLVQRWQQRFLQYAVVVTGDSNAAYDIVQDCWLAIIKGIVNLNDPAKFKVWALRIVYNKSATWIRKKQANRKLMQNFSEYAKEGSGKNDQTTQEVRYVLMNLPDKYRSVMTLYYFEKLSISDLASVFKVPEGTIKSRLYKARDCFKQEWNKKIKGDLK